MYSTTSRTVCENTKWDKPGKNDPRDLIRESLRMVSPDCDKKRTGPCKLLASSTTNLKGK
jgi:hypothetical protein